MEQLLALNCEQAGELWGSVWGERLWHWLHGEDFDMAETEHLKSISHSHVLAPEMRTAEKAWAVAHKLLHKAAMRLRAGGLWASSIGLAVGFAVPRSEKRARQPLRRPHPRMARRNSSSASARTTRPSSPPSAASGQPAPPAPEYDQPYFIGVQLNGLVPDRLHSLNLFDAPRRRAKRAPPARRHGRAEPEIRHEHPRPRHHAHRLQSRAHTHRLPQHSRSVLTSPCCPVHSPPRSPFHRDQRLRNVIQYFTAMTRPSDSKTT